MIYNSCSSFCTNYSEGEKVSKKNTSERLRKSLLALSIKKHRPFPHNVKLVYRIAVMMEKYIEALRKDRAQGLKKESLMINRWIRSIKKMDSR